MTTISITAADIAVLPSPEQAAHETAAALQDVLTRLDRLEGVIGREGRGALDDAILGFESALRREAAARLVAAALVLADINDVAGFQMEVRADRA